MESPPLLAGKTIAQWCDKLPLLRDLMACREVCWFNPQAAQPATSSSGLTASDIDDAARRLARFAPLVAVLFPETAPAAGIIESPLVGIPAMQRQLAAGLPHGLPGRLLLKCDHMLPISGSIKARGGIYEVLKLAETLARQHGLLATTDNYRVLASNQSRHLFGQHRIAVGSTGNLGLSIGIMGAALGFTVTVHMSADARQWKKDKLRSHGVNVVEHAEDYGAAVAAGRREAADDPTCHFIDDENSVDLFLGYAVAGQRLADQLMSMHITVDGDHPLFVYLPCGVGGGPGGVTFGLKQIFGQHVHCLFAEPTHSPCMLLGLATGLHDRVAVEDFGLDNSTAADGLAVGRPSGFIGKTIGPLIDGCCTVADATLFSLLAQLADSEQIFMEPSALAGMAGPGRIVNAPDYLHQHDLTGRLHAATHIVWGTGGSMVPEDEMNQYYLKGCTIREKSSNHLHVRHA